jgi:hypothetical protein
MIRPGDNAVLGIACTWSPGTGLSAEVRALLAAILAEQT